MIGRPAPLQDWMSHLARVHILHAMLHGDAFWRQFYRINTFLLPNVVLDAVLLLLLRLGLDLQTAGQIFLLATYAAWVGGFCMLSWALRAYDDQKPLFAAILFFSGSFYWGSVNFVAGVALIPWFLAGVIRFRDRPWIGALLAAVGATAIFFCHVVAAALLVSLLTCFDLMALVRSRQPIGRCLLRSSTGLVAALVVLILLGDSPTGPDLGSLTVKYVGSGSLFGFAYWKVSIFLRALVEGGGIPSAALTLFGLGIFAGLSLFGAQLTMDAAALIAFVALLVATIAAPQRFGTGSFLDYRLALIPLVVLAVAVRWTWRRAVIGRVAFVTVLVVLLGRTVSALVGWSAANRVYSAFEIGTTSLPEESVLLTAWGRPPRQIGWGEWWSPSVGNISTLAALHGTFVPTVFALATQQPLVLKVGYQSWRMFLNLTDPTHVATALRRVAPFCDLEKQRVFVTLLFPSKTLDPSIGRARAVFRNSHVRVLDICPVADTAAATAR